MKPRIPVVELIRVSTSEQAEDDRAGLARQEAACRAAAAAHGLEVVHRIRLVDVSGTSVQETPEMAELLRLVRSGQARGVVVADFDRLLRPDDFRSFAVLQDILESGALIYMADQVLDLSTQAGWLTTSLQSVIAGNERTQIMKRLSGAKEAMRRVGKHPGGEIALPRGVSYDKAGSKYFYNDEAPLVRELFRLFHDCRIHNYAELARRTGLGRTNIPNLLTNPLFIGLRVYDEKRGKEKYASENGRRAAKKRVKRGPDEIIEVRVMDKPLVPEEVFWAVRDTILNKRRRVAYLRTKGNLTYLFKGMLRCGVCGSPIYTSGVCASRGGARTYYACRRNTPRYRRLEGGCSSRLFRGADLEEQLVAFIGEQMAQEEYILAQVAGMGDHEGAARRKVALGKVQNDIKANAVSEKRLVDLYVDGGVDRGLYDRKLTELRKARAKLEAQAKTLAGSGQAMRPEEYAEAVAALAGAFCEFAFWTRLEQREFLEKLRPEFWITREGVTRVSLPLGNTEGMTRGEGDGRISAAFIFPSKHSSKLEFQVSAAFAHKSGGL